ncbi:MAG: rhamnogalacturonan acetylesterase [Clostridia bacterium]|nr:rhamnogalacturonan acetylesterase [Clostridia bacterium]
MLFKKILTGTMAAVMLMGSMGVSASADENEVKIFIVGDSTACIYGSDDNYAVPRAGWGMYLGNYIKGAEVVDLAKSGRSSKSLTAEEEYQTLLNEMGEGDYLLIQFGHNDAKKSSEEDLNTRYTDPEGDKDTDGSFKNSLYNNYVKKAEEKGATPILITPISRRSFDENGNVNDTHGLYDDAVRELAEELNISCVDATSITADLYNETGLEGTAAFHAIYKDVTKGDKGHDNTHLNHYGANVVAYNIAKELKNIAGIGEYTVFSGSDANYITRADFTYGIVRIIGGEYTEADETGFDDVLASDAAAAAISTAKKLGIVTGDENGNFNPDNVINLQEMCTITARALKYAGTELNEDESALESLSKSESIKPYAKGSIAGLINLWGDVIPSYANPRVLMTKGDAYTIYSLLYDEINVADENAVAQSIDEIEKVE